MSVHTQKIMDAQRSVFAREAMWTSAVIIDEPT
jgi:hypothetical protein